MWLDRAKGLLTSIFNVVLCALLLCNLLSLQRRNEPISAFKFVHQLVYCSYNIRPMRKHEGVCPRFTFNLDHDSSTCHLVCAGLKCTHKRLIVFSHLNALLLKNDYCIYKQKKNKTKQNKTKQRKAMFKVPFLQARICATVQETVWVRSSNYISVKYRLGSELTVHLSSGCCVLNWQNCQASSLVLNSEKLVSLILTSFCCKHWLSLRGL